MKKMANSAGTPSEDNTYINLKDLREQKRNNNRNQKDAPAAAKNTQHQVLVALVILLILTSLVLVILTSLLFINYINLAEEVSQIKNNSTQILKSELNELQKRGAENVATMKRKLNELESRVKERTSEIQRNVEKLKKKPSCESGWVEFEGHCYFFSDFEQSWAKAQMMCLSRGSRLVIVNSQAEQNFLRSNSHEIFYWIGLTDLEKEGTFKWVDGTGLSFRSWVSGEPNDGGRKEDCVHLAKEGNWNDMFCDENIKAVCEKRMIGN